MARGEESAAVARGVGKSNGDETDDEEKLYEDDDNDAQSVGKNSDEISGFVDVTSIVGGHVGQNHNLYVITLGPIFLDLPVIWP
jgi:hypothetical protein